MTSSEYAYAGKELDVFAHAHRWKRYWSSQIGPYVHGDVLEVGAGIGANTRVLFRPELRSWLCLEPDPVLLRRLQLALAADPALARCGAAQATIGELGRDLSFDAILYIDVLEHIEDDREELRQAAARLRPGGFLIVLSPAHQWLYSDFDRTIGHFRRYSKRSLAALSPEGTVLASLRYLDSAGVVLSACNRLILKHSMPTTHQIVFWDRFIIPCSRLADWATRYTVGKSVLGVWGNT